jgi:hypothetical protein
MEEARICCEDTRVTNVKEDIYPEDPRPLILDVSCVDEI